MRFPWQCPIQKPVLLQFLQILFCWIWSLPIRLQSLQRFFLLCCGTLATHFPHWWASRWVGVLLCNRNVHSSFESQTSHSGKPDGVLDHALCSEVLDGSPIVVMKWFNIVVSNHEAYTAHSMTRKSFFFLFSSPRLVPLGSLFWAHPGAVPFPPHRTYTGPTQYMSISDVACEGSHMRNFGRLVVESTLYPPPFQGVVPTQHSSTLGLGPYCGLTVH